MIKMIFYTMAFLLLLVGCHSISDDQLPTRIIPLTEYANTDSIGGQEKTQKILFENELTIRNENYYISISYSDVNTEQGDKCRVPYFNVSGMKDKALEKLINNELEIGAISWIKGKVDVEHLSPPMILSHDNRFLCVGTELSISDGRWRYNHFMTVDIQTGMRVYLNDLIRVDREFAQYFRDGNIVRTVTGASEDFDFDGNITNLNDFLSRMSLDETLKELEQCSKNQTEFSYDDSLNNLLFSNSFYVEPDKIIITFRSSGGEMIRFCINLEDMSDFLIVSKW